MNTRVVIVPPVPALLPSYLGRVDPLPELRDACHTAVSWLVDGGVEPVVVLTDEPDPVARSRGIRAPLGLRVARHLLTESGYELEPCHGAAARSGRSLLVLANGSARRGERAPGHFDVRSFTFDEHIESALDRGDPSALVRLDPGLGGDLLAAGIEPLRQLGAMGHTVAAASLLYADDPYGVRYWVATWDCAPSGS